MSALIPIPSALRPILSCARPVPASSVIPAAFALSADIGRSFPRFAAGCMLVIAAAASLVLSGCETTPKSAPVPVGPSAEDISKQQRTERAVANLNEALKRYEAGAYDESMRSYLLALDSGQLTAPQQIGARKQMAFMHCVSNKEAACREEFEKILLLDPKFDLPPAEAGHPTWGPVFRGVKNSAEARKAGRLSPTAPTARSALADKLLADAASAYEAADYNRAVKSYQDALKEPLNTSDQVKAHKFSAFSYCLSNRANLCRAEFEKILQLKPDFELEPAEAGHPSWGPSFRGVKTKFKPTAVPALPKK